MTALGVTVGKFLPFHRGHDHLIRAAKAQVDTLAVIVGARHDQPVPGETRAAWIRESHPDIEVIVTVDDLPEAPEPWAERTLHLLHPRRPGVAFSSEAYGDPWGAAMGARHVAIDPARQAVPTSGRTLRADLGQHWEMLMPPAKAFFARRVCVLGVESSGTTTLAEALARTLETAWVPEYGRWYWEGRRHLGNASQWESDELVRIAQGQRRWEDDLARKANRVLIADTDALATAVWHRRYVGTWSDAVDRLADERPAELYLLTAPDFEPVQDGTRESTAWRPRMHEWLVNTLSSRNVDWHLIEGPPAVRLDRALELVEPLRHFSPF